MSLTNIANLLGISTATVYVLIIALFLVGMYVYYRAPKDKKNYVFVGAAVLVMIFVLFANKQAKTEETYGANWTQKYASAASTGLGEAYATNIKNTDYYDIDSSVISQTAEKILKESATPREAVENALKYTYENVEYTYGEADASCLQGTAPSVLQSGKGQCDTQSIVLVALLRKIGIAAKPIGGCIMVNKDCKMQSVFMNSGLSFLDIPKTQPINLEGETFSRGGGGLHAWVAAWVPEQGWVPLEATTGMIADTKCYVYHVEVLPQNDQKGDICTSKNKNYAVACRDGNMAELNAEGLGVMNVVLK